jgi:amino-acid N-acetyltransferase
MKISYRKATQTDEPIIRAVLEESKLHTESLGGKITEFFLAEQGGVIVGVAGFEYYGDDALLRSVAILSRERNKGTGSAMIDWMLSRAKEQRIKRIVLLTNTAKKFFEKKGFTVVPRATITNEAMQKCSEFAYLCSDSSTTMTMNLTELIQ